MSHKFSIASPGTLDMYRLEHDDDVIDVDLHIGASDDSMCAVWLKTSNDPQLFGLSVFEGSTRCTGSIMIVEPGA